MLREKEEFWINPVLLGRGAFSEVYRVTERKTGIFLACKISTRLKMGEREAMLLARVQHPLFPEYRGHFIEGEGHYLLMEYICGMNLGSYVRKRGKLSQKRAVQIAMELAEGLTYLHEQSEQIIFRDIKPENVLIQQDGKVRLVDLGCAYMSGSVSNGRAGSPGYAAPEQFDETGEVGMESDVYALGMLLHFMLTGCETPGSTACMKPGMRRSRISPALKKLIGQATHENALQRIQDMRTFMQKLAACEQRGFVKNILHRKKDASFHYQKNIRKGL